MVSEFSVRERILLCLRDETTEGTVGQIANWIGSNDTSVSARLSEMYAEGLISTRHSGSVENPILYSLTDRGHDLAKTQVWRMRSVGKQSIAQLPKVRKNCRRHET